MAITVPDITLNNGVLMPQVGFGVFQVPDAETTTAVRTALDAGYRSIDTAAIYGNESGVGAAIHESGIARDELFVTTKLWNADQGYDATLTAFDASLQKLGLDRIDLYLIHWPAPERDLYSSSWRALESLLTDGRVRAIGVSNFQPQHLARLADESGIVPAVNQVELHPALQQKSVTAYDAEHGIATEAWSPLAQGATLSDPVILAIAEAHSRSAAQVVLRWHLQRGRIVIPKSVTPSRIAANLDVFDFDLDDTELQAIDGLDRGDEGRTGPHPDSFNG